MDKKNAIRITNEYLNKLLKNHIDIHSAYLFGSFAKDKYHRDSDIDLAIVLDKALNTFETEIKLMTLRTGDETLIEPHIFDLADFHTNNPLIEEIVNTGIKIEI